MSEPNRESNTAPSANVARLENLLATLVSSESSQFVDSLTNYTCLLDLQLVRRYFIFITFTSII